MNFLHKKTVNSQGKRVKIYSVCGEISPATNDAILP